MTNLIMKEVLKCIKKSYSHIYLSGLQLKSYLTYWELMISQITANLYVLEKDLVAIQSSLSYYN